MPVNEDRPNLVLIMTDQQRGDALGIEGRKGLDTPNLDYLAASGARFTRAYSTCPSCIPARRALLSGQFPATNGMVGMQGGVEWNPRHTMPGMLREAGYQTFLVGRSMHQHPPSKRYGYDHMEDLNIPYTPSAYQDWLADNAVSSRGGMWGHGIDPNGWIARPWHLEEHMHPTNWTVQQSLKFLERRDTSCPFFLTVSLLPPHPPLIPPAFYMQRYLDRDLGGPVIGEWANRPPSVKGQDPRSNHVILEGETWHNSAAGYYGLINHIDDQIDLLLRELKRNHPNTLIIFTSDHGELLGDHYLFRKVLPYEGSARIPLLVNGPMINSGLVVDRPACLEDIMPTFLDAAGIEIPDSLDGRSLLPLCKDQRVEWRDTIHVEHAPCYQADEGYHMLTDGKQKYIWYTETGQEQLFDLTNDPTECRDLAPIGSATNDLELWRGRMIEELKNRPEAFTDGNQLIKGRPYARMLPA